MTASGRVSAGLLMYRGDARSFDVLLGHPGGPYFAKRDQGAWTIPKGLVNPGEELRAAALREFTEEVGIEVESELIELGYIVQKGGKQVYAWACVGDVPAGFQPKSNLFEIEWPPRSGKRRSFPELDRVEFFDAERARDKLNPAQLPFLERLQDQLARSDYSS